MKKTLFLLSLLLSGIVLTAEARLSKSALDIPVYEGAALEDQFEIIGKVVVQAGTVQDLQKIMSRTALRNGGDAVLQYRVVNYGGVQMGAVTDRIGRPVYGVNAISLPMAEGVIVNYVRYDGIREIDGSVAVPMLD